MSDPIVDQVSQSVAQQSGVTITNATFAFVIVFLLNIAVAILNFFLGFLSQNNQTRHAIQVEKSKDAISTLKTVFNSIRKIQNTLNDPSSHQLNLQLLQQARLDIDIQTLIFSSNTITTLHDYADYLSVALCDSSRIDKRAEQDFEQKVRKHYKDL